MTLNDKAKARRERIAGKIQRWKARVKEPLQPVERPGIVKIGKVSILRRGRQAK